MCHPWLVEERTPWEWKEGRGGAHGSVREWATWLRVRERKRDRRLAEVLGSREKVALNPNLMYIQ
jgi:hypothetical protein